MTTQLEIQLVKSDTFETTYQKLVALARNPELNQYQVGQSLTELEEKLKESGNAPQFLVEQVDETMPQYSLVELYSRLVGSFYSGVVEGTPRKINPNWNEDIEQFLTSEWEQMGGAHERYGTGGCAVRTAYFVTENPDLVLLTTEPFELASAHWPDAEGIPRRKNGYYFRNKHTGEVLGSIIQDFGWSWDGEFKYMDENDKPIAGGGHLLRGAFLTLFYVANDRECIGLDGKYVPQPDK